MDPRNATQPPAPLLPPPALRWDGQVLLACVVLGLPANAVTLWLTGWRLRCRGLAAFIFSLAASDFLFLANSILQIWSVAHRHVWPLGSPSCRLHQYLYALGYYSGLFLLAAISLDRCLLVAAPFWYRCRRPRRLTAAACAGAWLAAGLCGAPEAAMSRIEKVRSGVTVCRSERGSWKVPLRWLEVVVEGLLPFGVVAVCHAAALALALCRRKAGGRAPARFQRIVAATLSAYAVLNMPFQVVQLLDLVATDIPAHVLYLLGLAFNLGSCLNPYIYLLLGSRLCHHLARLLRGVLARLPPATRGPPATLTLVTSDSVTPGSAAAIPTGPPTTAVSTGATAPGPPTAVTSGPPTATTPGPPTAVTSEPPTATTPGPPTAVTSGPATAITSGPSVDTTSGPPTAVNSEPPTAVTPGTPTAVTSGPSVDTIPGPTTAVTSVPPTAATPGPPTAVTSMSPTATTPGPPTAVTSGPPTATTPGPPTAVTSEPPTATTPGPPTAVTSMSPTATTPGPPTAVTSGPSADTTPEPPTAVTPGSPRTVTHPLLEAPAGGSPPAAP